MQAGSIIAKNNRPHLLVAGKKSGTGGCVTRRSSSGYDILQRYAIAEWRPYTGSPLALCSIRLISMRNSTTASRTSSSRGSVLRLDEMTGTWVVFAAGRSDRPKQTKAHDLKIKLGDLSPKEHNCPFCEGNENMLTHNILLELKGAVDDNDIVRVVPNKYPAVGSMTNHKHQQQHRKRNVISPVFETDDKISNLYHETPAVGFHEVVIESKYHNAHIATSPVIHAKNLLLAFRERGRNHATHEGVEHTCYFKNHGGTAGASLVHPHAQIVSTPVVPVEAQRLQSLALEFFNKNRFSLYDKIIEDEIMAYERYQDWIVQRSQSQVKVSNDEENTILTSRVVDVSNNFVSMTPYASPGPYEMTIFPRYGKEMLGKEGIDCSDFTSTTDELIDECAIMLKRTLERLHLLLDEPCFNLVIQSSPVSNRGTQAAYHSATFFRWHIRITPRLGAGAMAGFELGSGFFSNSHMPEDDAAELRGVKLST